MSNSVLHHILRCLVLPPSYSRRSNSERVCCSVSWSRWRKCRWKVISCSQNRKICSEIWTNCAMYVYLLCCVLLYVSRPVPWSQYVSKYHSDKVSIETHLQISLGRIKADRKWCSLKMTCKSGKRRDLQSWTEGGNVFQIIGQTEMRKARERKLKLWHGTGNDGTEVVPGASRWAYDRLTWRTIDWLSRLNGCQSTDWLEYTWSTCQST